MSTFAQSIMKFNHMYGLPVEVAPRLHADPLKRLNDLKAILAKELSEIDQIIAAVESEEAPLTILTDLADLMGDLQVYCASEMCKWGIPLDETLRIIMSSNFSKLGADGQPIVNDQGKVQKGPNYWKPEPQLAEMLVSWGAER